MIKEELKKKIEDTLKRMTCKNIVFSNGEEGKTTVRFDCDTLLSFVMDTEDWKYAGIQPNDQGTQKYKIEFRK
jgi:anthranilate phosphoribosyltransferase